MRPVQMRRKHVQATLTAAQYRAFREAAGRQGLTLQQAAQDALLRWVGESGGDDPFQPLIGRYEGTADASTDVDADYESD